MSDSEDDFASADEGEMGTSEQKKPGKSEDPKNLKETQEAKAVDSNKQSKSDSKKTSNPGKGQGEDPAARPKKGKGGDGKKPAPKAQEVSSASGGKGKSSNQKKGKEKGEKKAGKEAGLAKTEPVVTKSKHDIDETESSSEPTVGSNNAAKGTETSEDTTKENDKERVSDEIVEKEDNKTESVASRTDIHNEKSLDNTVLTKTEALNIEEVRTNSENNSAEKVECQSKDLQAESKSTESTPKPAELLKSPSTQSIPRPEPDHTDDQEKVLERLAGAAQETKQSGWGWGWGSSLLNVASSSVSTFTHQVGEGFNTMIETVESTLNVPSPEDLVMKTQGADGVKGKESEDKSEMPISPEGATGEDKKADDISQDKEKTASAEVPSAAGTQSPQDSSDGWFSSWGVGNITKMVESTGKNLVSGSLDVLETLGKKTFDALNEHDPGLKKTRGLLKEQGDKPNLSAVLREACEQHEERVKLEKESEEARKVHFGTLFDDFQGLAHLEALEILSNQSERKVNSLLMALPPDLMASLKPQLLEIKANFEIGDEDEEEVDDHDFTKLITDIYSQLNVGISAEKLTKIQDKIRSSLKEFLEKNSTEEKPALKEIHLVAIQSLAEFTSKCIEQFHKAGEMILLHKAENSDFVSASLQLNSLTKVLCIEVGILSTKFTECLNRSSESEETVNVNQLVTSIYLEASNSSSYIQDGFQLLLPVLQQAAIEKNQEPAS